MTDLSHLTDDELRRAFEEARAAYAMLLNELGRRATLKLSAAYGPELPLVGDIHRGTESGLTWPEYRIAWCFYCGERPGWQREHKTPKIRGGTDAPDNIVRSCQRCNVRKGTMTLAEYRSSQERRHGKPFFFFGERK